MDNENYTVLVVDDMEQNRDLLAHQLELAGFKTVKADGEQETKKALSEKVINLVLLDIMMPKVDGITLLSEIRENSEYSNIPVIMVTALDVIDVAQECLRKGACGYVTKPYDIDLIKQKIIFCLNK